jgi:MtfA peptidase
MKIFIAEKTWEGCNGLQIDEEMKCVIASQAALMLTGIEDYCFEGVRTLLVYPQGFRRQSGDGLLIWKEWRAGEAWHRGPIVLSWADIRHGWSRGHNLVVHELAHHLDGLDGYMDGLFSPGKPALRDEWARVSKREIDRLQQQVDFGMESLLDPYGATSPAEFFAVVSEAFFEFSLDLRDEHPDLYRLLSGFFNADPASWKLPDRNHPP